MRLIIKYFLPLYVVPDLIPVEYISKESLLKDFEFALDQAIKYNNYSFFILSNSRYITFGLGYFYNHKTKEKILPVILTVDEWFESHE